MTSIHHYLLDDDDDEDDDAMITKLAKNLQQHHIGLLVSVSS